MLFYCEFSGGLKGLVGIRPSDQCVITMYRLLPLYWTDAVNIIIHTSDILWLLGITMPQCSLYWFRQLRNIYWDHFNKHSTCFAFEPLNGAGRWERNDGPPAIFRLVAWLASHRTRTAASTQATDIIVAYSFSTFQQTVRFDISCKELAENCYRDCMQNLHHFQCPYQAIANPDEYNYLPAMIKCRNARERKGGCGDTNRRKLTDNAQATALNVCQYETGNRRRGRSLYNRHHNKLNKQFVNSVLRFLQASFFTPMLSSAE